MSKISILFLETSILFINANNIEQDIFRGHGISRDSVLNGLWAYGAMRRKFFECSQLKLCILLQSCLLKKKKKKNKCQVLFKIRRFAERAENIWENVQAC